MSQTFEELLADAKRVRRDEMMRLLRLAAAMPAVLLDELQPQLRRCVDRLGAAAGAESTEHR